MHGYIPDSVNVRKMKSSSSSACPEHESVYERILRKGYGPPGGDKLDRDGWRCFFDEMVPSEYHNMVLDVFGDVLPKEWEPEDVPVEWFDVIDKNLTSSSEAFTRYPEFQIMFQKGYGPPDGDKLDVEDWAEYMDAMPEDKHDKMMKELFPSRPQSSPELWEKYHKQMRESEGFDVDVRIPDGCGTLVPMFYDMSYAKTDNRLNKYSRMALDTYNDREHSDYILDEVVKACTQLVAGQFFYITFEATNSEGHHQVFQAKVFEPIEGKDEILLVRPKAEKA